MAEIGSKEERLIPLTQEEIDNWYYHGGIEKNLILDVQKRVLYRAIDRIIEVVPKNKRERMRKLLEYELKRYPIVYDDGSPDHPVFLPEKYRQEEYYGMVMRNFRFYLGGESFPLFKQAIEEGIEDISIQIEPRFEELREIGKEYAKKRKRVVGRWHLNSLEKSLVKEGVAKLGGLPYYNLELQKRKLFAGETDSVVRTIKQFFGDKENSISQQDLNKYIEIYGDMKRYLQLVPYFVDDLFNKFNGSLIFLDRDARPLYEGAKIFKEHRQEKQSLHLIPVTRTMIPNEYIEAHKRERGELPEVVRIWMQQREPASYKWGDGRVNSLKEKEEKAEILRKKYGDKLTLENATKSQEFREEGEKLYSFLEYAGVLVHEQITIVDAGLFGTASDFTQDVIKYYFPEKEVNSHLFFSNSNQVEGFIQKELPKLGLSPLDYIVFYESFPKSIPSVEGFEKKGNIWVPKYNELTPEESKWIRGIEGEVYLGARLVKEAVRNSTVQYLFDNPKLPLENSQIC